MPIPKEQIKVGVLYQIEHTSEISGWTFSHETGIQEMIKHFGFKDAQVFRRGNIYDEDALGAESAIRDLIAWGANIIFATSLGYMNAIEKLAKEFPSVIFAHASGNKYNDTNFTNYFGNIQEARYLAGLIAGMKTKSGKIGYVTGMGKEHSLISSGINAFALGVEKVNPAARIYVRTTYSWFDPMEERAAARSLIARGCDVITLHCDSADALKEAEKAGAFGIGYNSDMAAEAPNAILTSVVWNWGVYYINMMQSVMDGSFTPHPYMGSLKDRFVDITPLNNAIPWEPAILRVLETERERIESGEKRIFEGVFETNDGKIIGKIGETIPGEVVQFSMNWYYRTVIEISNAWE
ncbi:MAG: BMP family ABC transporter substrate-binding protein [Spirochaetota bacterium]|nr:BMP family ABC transporter substrate-binding protein [Spirochaetota bacterium]